MCILGLFMNLGKRKTYQAIEKSPQDTKHFIYTVESPGRVTLHYQRQAIAEINQTNKAFPISALPFIPSLFES